MPRKTLILIGCLAAVVVLLIVIAVLPKSQTTKKSGTPTSSVPVETQHSILALNPNPIMLGSNTSGTVDLFLDTNGDNVTGVQMEATFDPKVLTVTDIKDGTFFAKQINLLKRIDPVKGTITYALVLPPDGTPKVGRGTVATIQFVIKDPTAKQTEIKLLPTSLVSAKGLSKSVMKAASGVTIKIGGTAVSQPSNGINYNGRPF